MLQIEIYIFNDSNNNKSSINKSGNNNDNNIAYLQTPNWKIDEFNIRVSNNNIHNHRKNSKRIMFMKKEK